MGLNNLDQLDSVAQIRSLQDRPFLKQKITNKRLMRCERYLIGIINRDNQMEDFLKINNLLSPEEKLIQQTVRTMVDDIVIPRMPDAFEKAEFPLEFISQCAKLGLFGMTLPEQWGGAHTSQVAYGLVCQELERGDSGLRSFVSVQNALCMYPIERYGSEEQKQKYLPPMIKGECIGCFGLTEPDIGSDPSHLKTHAKKVPGGYQINGSKLWITNATIADIAIVWARTEKISSEALLLKKRA